MFGDIKKYNKTEIICSPLQVEYIFFYYFQEVGEQREPHYSIKQYFHACLVYSSIEKKLPTYKHDNNTGSSII